MCKKRLTLLAIIAAIIMVFPSVIYGESRNITTHREVTASGIVKKQGITTYMYGTHVLSDRNDKTLYALSSTAVDLDAYLDQEVTVKGTLVEGYPVDTGPAYLEVTSIKSNGQ